MTPTAPSSTFCSAGACAIIFSRHRAKPCGRSAHGLSAQTQSTLTTRDEPERGVIRRRCTLRCATKRPQVVAYAHRARCRSAGGGRFRISAGNVRGVSRNRSPSDGSHPRTDGRRAAQCGPAAHRATRGGAEAIFSPRSCSAIGLAAARLVWATIRSCCAAAVMPHSRRSAATGAGLKWLLDHGADPNARWAHWDSDVTALHLAALADHPAIVKPLLLDAGAAQDDSRHETRQRRTRLGGSFSTVLRWWSLLEGAARLVDRRQRRVFRSGRAAHFRARSRPSCRRIVGSDRAPDVRGARRCAGRRASGDGSRAPRCTRRVRPRRGAPCSESQRENASSRDLNPPRDVLMRIAPRFIRASVSPLIIPLLVSGEDGTGCRLTMSLPARQPSPASASHRSRLALELGLRRARRVDDPCRPNGRARRVRPPGRCDRRRTGRGCDHGARDRAAARMPAGPVPAPSDDRTPFDQASCGGEDQRPGRGQRSRR